MIVPRWLTRRGWGSGGSARSIDVGDAVAASELAQMAGAPRVTEPAAWSMAAGLWERALAGAESSNPAVTRSVLRQVAASVLSSGGALLYVVGRGLRVAPGDRVEVRGTDPDRPIWTVRHDLPSGAVSEPLRVNNAAWIAWRSSPGRPWEGKPPVSRAARRRLAELEGHVLRSHPAIVPIHSATGGMTAEMAEAFIKEIKDGFGVGRGRESGSLMPVVTAGDVSMGSPIRPAPDPGALAAWRHGCRDLLSACGVDSRTVALEAGDGAGSGQGARVFRSVQLERVAAVAADLEAGLRPVLGDPRLTIRVETETPQDRAARIGSAAKLIAADVEQAEAFEIAGLDGPGL